MALRQTQNAAQSGEMDRTSGYTDLSEIVCLFWDYLIADPCYSLVSISDGYVKRLMQTDYSMTVEEIKRAITYHRQSLQSVSGYESSLEWWEHLGEIAALEEHLIAVIEESVYSTLGQVQNRHSHDVIDRFILLLAKAKYQRAQTISEPNPTPATTVALMQGLIDACMQILSLPDEPALASLKDSLFTEIAVMQELVDAYLQILSLANESVIDSLENAPRFEIPFPWEQELS